MKEYLSLDFEKREKIIGEIKKILFNRKEVIFAYIFGSFVDSPSFKDIDIAVYLEKIKEKEVFNYELKISKLIADKCEMPFDIIEVHVLNFATGSFLNNIFCRGELLFSKNQNMLSNMIEDTSLRALANEYISCQSLKELTSV